MAHAVLDNPAGQQLLTADVLDSILQNTLPELVSELGSSSWYVSEHAVINLFIFGHLVPAFRKRGCDDLTFMGMEASVLQIEKSTPCRPSTRKDMVFWKKPRSTRWKGYDLSDATKALDKFYVQEHGCKPLAVVEWKNINRFQRRSKVDKVKAEHQGDVQWLRASLRMQMLEVGYAILLDQRK